jgi:hypothetical protein
MHHHDHEPPSATATGTNNWCTYLAAHPPVAPDPTSVTCTNTVITRPDVAAIRLLKSHGTAGPITPVRHQTAEIPDTTWTRQVRHDWRIEAYGANGQPLGTVRYTNTL